MPVEVAIPIALVLGAAGGLLNGVLVTRLRPAVARRHARARSPCIRGLALVVLGSEGVSGFPDWFTSFGFGTVPGTPIPWPLLIFVGLAIVLGVVLHAMWPGRQLFALGKNASAARYSGVRVARTKLLLFVLNGTIAALAGVILTARFASSRADIGQGLTLTVVTIVLLGGVNIFGGRGTIPGVVLAAAVLAVLGNVLRLTNVSAEIQSIAVGVLLVVSVVIPNFAHQIRHGSPAWSQVGRGSAATAGAGGASQLMKPGGSTLKSHALRPHRRTVARGGIRRRGLRRRGATTAPSAASAAAVGRAAERLRQRRRRLRRPVRGRRRTSTSSFIPKAINNPYFDAAARARRRRPPSSAGSSSRSARRTRPLPSRSRSSRTPPRRATRRSSSPPTGADEVAPALKAAKDAGIKVVGYDSSPAEGAYDVFVNQTDFSLIGSSMAQWACDLAPDCTGEIAILSATATATNQNAWIDGLQEGPHDRSQVREAQARRHRLRR